MTGLVFTTSKFPCGCTDLILFCTWSHFLLHCVCFIRCPHCMSSKNGTIFHCPKSDLLGDSGRVEWEVYEKVDLTEIEYKGIRQGKNFHFVCAFVQHLHTCKHRNTFVLDQEESCMVYPRMRERIISESRNLGLVNSSLNICYPKYQPFSSIIKLS